MGIFAAYGNLLPQLVRNISSFSIWMILWDKYYISEGGERWSRDKSYPVF